MSTSYHLAGNASIYEKDPSRYFTINVDGTKNIMDAALKLGVKRMVFTSSAGVIGPSVGGIVTEEKVREIDFLMSTKALKQKQKT